MKGLRARARGTAAGGRRVAGVAHGPILSIMPHALAHLAWLQPCTWVWAECLCVGSSLSAMRLVFAVFGAKMMSLKIGTIKERR